ncbi:MAG TPA: acyl-CoA dehydrogenase family protein [Acidimicrobiales bacterium]|nr:acyl-CoA dehydrogenase family protein [Acidimicrobiales bacterium]
MTAGRPEADHQRRSVDFRLPPPVEAFRDQLRAWLVDNLTDEVRDAARRRGVDDDALATLRSWDRTMAEAGWAAISWPAGYGGRGATALEQLVFTEETIAAGAPTPVNVIGINNIAPAIMQYGTEQQKRELLPRMVRADDIWCQGMSEPDAGSDLASLRTRAVRDGDDFVVTGQKTWTSNGHRADWCALFVRTNPDAPKHQGISCLVVDMRSPGIQARPLRTLTGDAEFAEVFFDDVRVPASALLGPLDGGWAVAASTLGHERAGAARLYAMIRLRLHDLVEDLRAAERRRLVDLDDPLLLARLGELDTRLAFLAVLCRRAIAAADGEASGSASLAKTVWGELEQDVAALGYDLLGAHDPGGRWSVARLSTRSLTIAGGTTQVNKNVTAQRVLGLPRR